MMLFPWHVLKAVLQKSHTLCAYDQLDCVSIDPLLSIQKKGYRLRSSLVAGLTNAFLPAVACMQTVSIALLYLLSMQGETEPKTAICRCSFFCNPSSQAQWSALIFANILQV